MSEARYPRVAAMKNAAAFAQHLSAERIQLGFDPELAPAGSSPLAQPFQLGDVRVGNRFCVLPMEGWDGTPDGEPSDLTIHRWQNFGKSGAKLIWGGEAVAVRHDGRANPHQLLLTPRTLPAIARLRDQLIAAHRDRFGADADADCYIGLQLTHSGRFSKPNLHERPEPIAAVTNPVLDARFASPMRVFTDDELSRLIDDFIAAAKMAADAGFRFVDVKHCHGYLGHELLGAHDRPGRFGGSLENRTRFMREIIDGIRANVPGLGMVVRLSAFDLVPHRKGSDGMGVPAVDPAAYPAAFGLLQNGNMDAALAEARQVLQMLQDRDVRWVCVTAGSPYYCPHAQRPALFPPSDGYEPPEDPLHGVARLLEATRDSEGGVSRHGHRRHRLFVPAGVAAARGPAPGARRPHRFRRARAHDAGVSGPAGRRAERRAAQAQADLPHVQRLHDRAAARIGVGLFPARSPVSQSS